MVIWVSEDEVAVASASPANTRPPHRPLSSTLSPDLVCCSSVLRAAFKPSSALFGSSRVGHDRHMLSMHFLIFREVENFLILRIAAHCGDSAGVKLMREFLTKLDSAEMSAAHLENMVG